MANVIRCKFYCRSVQKEWNAYDKRFLYTYEFSPVMDGSEENKKFFAYTPTGMLKVGTVLIDAFEPGKDYYLDISEVPAMVEAPAEKAPDVPAEKPAV